MKHFLITYTRKNGTADALHEEAKRFVSALDSDPKIKGRIAYRCMRVRESDIYVHVATAADDAAPRDLAESQFFKDYTEAIDSAAGTSIEGQPLEIIAETVFRA
jgi:hypothetical protein